MVPMFDIIRTVIRMTFRSSSEQKAQVTDMDRCEQCTACIKQCPSRTILADPPIRDFAAYQTAQ